MAAAHLHQRAIIGHVDAALFFDLGVVVAALDGCALGLAAALGAVDVFGQVLHRLGKQLLDVAFNWFHGVFVGPVRAAGLGVAAQHHLRMGGEILVDVSRALRGLHLGQPLPRLPCGFLAFGALLQENHVCHHFGASVVLEGGLWQADSAHQVGAFAQILAGAVGGLVHRALAGHKHQQATRLHAVDGLGKEVIVQQEALLLVLWVGLDFDLAKWRVADGRIKEVARQLGGGEVAHHNVAGRVQQARNVARDGVVLDAGVLAVAGHRIGHQAVEQAHPHAGFKHLATVEAHAIQCAVNTADDRLAGVVRVLGGAFGLRVFFRRQGGLEALTQLTPVGLVVAVLVGEDAVGDLAGTPASELGQQRLFFRRGLTAFGGDLLDQLNNADVLLGGGFPAAGALQLSGSNSVI